MQTEQQRLQLKSITLMQQKLIHRLQRLFREVVFPHRALEAGVTVEILIPQVLHSQMMEIIPLILTIQTLPEMQQQIIHRTVSLWIRQNRK